LLTVLTVCQPSQAVETAASSDRHAITALKLRC
jgi:hypothetical protein